MTLWEDIKRPFNLLIFAIAVIGTVGTFYFYFFPHNEKKITYLSEGPSLIFDSKLSTPKLHLVDANNISVKSDTYLQTFTLWNNGSAPIEPADVRTPVRFVFEGAEQILDYKIVKSIQPEVSGFSLSIPTETNQAANLVELQWKHFDPKTAVKIQVIFAQSTTPKPSISENILGIEKFISGTKRVNNKELLIDIPIAVLGLLVGGFIIRESIRKKYGLGRVGVIVGIVQILTAFSLILMLLWTDLLSPLPPI